MPSIDIELIEQASHYVIKTALDEDVTRLNIQLSSELVLILDAITDKTSRSRSTVIEQLLWQAFKSFPASRRLD